MKDYPGLGGLFLGGTTVLLLVEPVWAATATQITAVKLNPTRAGLEVMLETQEGDRPSFFVVNRSDAFVAELIGTQLRLPQGNVFRQENPAPGISSVVLVQMDVNSVRLIVNGKDKAPTGQASSQAGRGIAFAVNSSGGNGTAAPAPSRNTPAAPQAPTAQLPPAGAPAAPPPQAPAPPAGQRPEVLIPNPQITIEGGPAPAAGAIQPQNQAPPFLPRAVPPPVGDISISELDSTGSSIDLGTGEPISRLLLRDAPIRDVLSLLSRLAGRNVVFVAPPAGATGQPGAQGQATGQQGATGLDGTISLDIENERLQDVFNYVLRITGLEANRNGNTIFVGSRLPDVARNVVVRSLRLNQVPVTTAANFLTAQGAETQLPIERVQIQTIGEGAAARTIEIREPDIKVLRAQRGEGPLVLSGLSVLTNERLNSITLVGDPRKVEVASAFLTQLDARRRQVAVNVKILDVNLLNTDFARGSVSFGIGQSFFTFDEGNAVLNFGGVRPPTAAQATASQLTPPIIGTEGTVFPQGVELEPFLDSPRQDAPFDNGGTLDPRTGRPITPRAPFGINSNPLQPGVTGAPALPAPLEIGLPQLFQFPSRLLTFLQAQITSNNAKILTDPTLVIQEGETATVNLGSEVVTNILTEQTVTNGIPVVTTRVEKDIAGLRLQVQINRIDDNGFVTLAVNPAVTVPGPTLPFQNTTITLLSRRDLVSGQIRLRDSQTLILSGIIQDTDRATVSKVPILGDIPILGALFRRTSRDNSRQEVIVLLTPQILDDTSNSQFGYRYRPGTESREFLRERDALPGSGNNRR